MRGLMIKDLCLMRNQAKSLLLILVVGLFLGTMTGPGSIIWFLVLLGDILGAGTLNYDEFDNGHAFLFTLPVTRKQYVREKYLFTTLFMLVCLAVSIPLSLILSRFSQRPVVFGMSEIVFQSAVAILLSGILLATLIPLRLKFGSEQSRIVWILFFGIIAALSFGGARLARKAGPSPALHKITGLLSDLNTWSAGKILMAAILITLILLFLSEQISERIIEKKEF